MSHFCSHSKFMQNLLSTNQNELTKLKRFDWRRLVSAKTKNVSKIVTCCISKIMPMPGIGIIFDIDNDVRVL